ncbi:MAG: hypothetical protein ACRCV0_06900 [Brevinema sp.]
MKKIILIISIIFCTIDNLHSFSKAPEVIVKEKPREPFLQYEYYDRKNKIIYYDILPFRAENFPFKRIELQPSISRNSIMGNTDFHLWITYNSEINTNSTEVFLPEFLTIDTLGREMRLPLMYTQSTNIIQKNKSEQYQFTAYIYLFPEDLEKLLGIMVDRQKPPVSFWEPDRIKERRAQLNELTHEFRPSREKLSNLALFVEEEIDFMEQNEKNTNTISESPFKEVIYKTFKNQESVLSQQKKITISLQNKTQEVSWSAPVGAFWMIFEAIILKDQLSTIPLP